MDPRRLVGMTQGAKKRAAQWEVYEARLEHLGSDIFKLGHTPWDRSAADYQKARADWRIGERLRPCRAIEHEGTPIYCSHCDGSGVLPAQRGKATK